MAAELFLQGATTVVAAGGDGTVNEVANGLALAAAAAPHLSPPTLGILPFGTMNVLAVELGLPKADPMACWRIIENGHRQHIDLWSLNGRAFLQLAGLGWDAEIIQQTTWEQKKALGPLSYLISAAKLLGKPSAPVTISVPGQADFNARSLLLGSGRYYGGPFKVFPQADNGDGLLDVVVLERDGIWPLVKGLAYLSWNEGRDMPRGVRYFQTRELRVSAPHSIAVEVDGELSTSAREIHVSPYPNGLHVMAPLP